MSPSDIRSESPGAQGLPEPNPSFSITDWVSIIANQIETVDTRKREYTRWTAAAITGIGVSIFVFLDNLSRASLVDTTAVLILLGVLVYLAVRMGVVLLQPFVTSALAVLLAAIKVPRGPAEAAASYLAVGEMSVSRLLRSPISVSAGVTVVILLLDLTGLGGAASGSLRSVWLIRVPVFLTFLALLIVTRRQARLLLPQKEEFVKGAETRFPSRRYKFVSFVWTGGQIVYYLTQLLIVGRAWVGVAGWSYSILLLLISGLLTGGLIVWARITWSIVERYSVLLRGWEHLQGHVLTGDIDSKEIQATVRDLLPTRL